jgi:hypothetical protein
VLDDVPRNDALFMVATDGLTIAHDIIEHVNGLRNIGTIHDEMEALGGIWFVRGQTGQLRRDNIGSAYTVEQNLAADLVRMWGEWQNEAAEFRPYRGRPPRPRGDYYEDVVETAQKISRHALEGIRREQEYRQDNEPLDEQVVADYLASARHYFLTGYRKARRRYDDRPVYANHMFWLIAAALDKWVKHVEYEGQRLRLGYSRGKARVWEILDEGY